MGLLYLILERLHYNVRSEKRKNKKNNYAAKSSTILTDELSLQFHVTCHIPQQTDLK